MMNKHKKYFIFGVIVIFIIAAIVVYRYIDGYDTNRLFKAIEKEDVSAVEDLLKDGVDPNRPDHMPIPVVDTIFEISSNVPLSLACDLGNYDIARLLIDYGAKAEYIDGMGWSPLRKTLFYYHKDDVKIVKLLLDNGADPEYFELEMPVFAAADMVPKVFDPNKTNGTIFSSGYDEETAQGITDIVIMLLGDNDINIRDNLGKTLLMYAADRGNINLTEYLISCGCDITVTDNNGMTAFEHANENGNKEIVELLSSMTEQDK